MEEQLTSLLISTLEEKENHRVDKNILENYYQLFDKKKYLGSGFEEIYNDMKEVYTLDLQSLRYGYHNQSEQIIYQDLILAVINETDTKKKIKLIPLIIYLDSNRVFYDYLYNISFFDDFVYDIKDFFIGTIKDSGVKVNNIEELPFYHQEKEWFENYKKGIESLNFKQIYSFIEGVERGYGYRFDVYLDFLVFIAYKYFFDDLVEIVNSKNDMFEIIYLTNILNIEETLNLALKSNNYLLKFESIRKSVYFKYNNYQCLNLRNLLKDIIIQLAQDNHIWQQFLYYFLEYPLRSIQLFEPMSKAILKIEMSCVYDIIQTIKIDNHFDEKSKEALNCLILNVKDDEIQKELLEQLFYRWNKFVDNYSEYLGSIILTNIIDIVIIYIRNFLDKTIVVENVNNIINNLDEIDNFWFKNRIEKINYFYKQMSKLFVYSFALNKYKCVHLKKNIFQICENSLILKKEQSNEKKTTLQLFDEYILHQENLYEINICLYRKF